MEANGNAFTASRFERSVARAYTSIVSANVECPRIACMAFGAAPRSKLNVVKVPRSEWIFDAVVGLSALDAGASANRVEAGQKIVSQWGVGGCDKHVVA